jgi:hypothetical protein
MPKVDEHKEEILRREIRLELGLNPLVSSRELQSTLERRLNHPVDRHYLLKLVHKVNLQVEYEGSNVELRGRVNQIRERTGAMIQRLLKIAFWKWEYLDDGIPLPSNIESIMAMQTIMKMDIAVLEAEKGNGLFKRTSGETEGLRPMLVNPEVKSRIADAVRAWNLAPTDAAQTETSQ